MQGTSKQAPIQLGRLSADDAERFASMFRPAWELDDAPFASGTKLSASEMDALAAPAGIAVEIATAAAVAPHFPPKSQPPGPMVESVEIELDPTPPPAPRAAPVAAKPPVPVAARPQPQAYVAPPRPVSMTDEDLAPPKKSSMGLFIGLGVVVALVGLGVAAKFALGGGEKTTTTTSTQTATQEERRIPPPPAAVDTTPPADTVAAKAPVDKGAGTTAATAAPPPPVATTPPLAAATHPAVVAGGGATPHATSTGAGTKPPPIATTKPNKSGIVRDNPF